ncbi:MAG: SRPBCC family protein, partial [Verrucomicrobiota bacterium]
MYAFFRYTGLTILCLVLVVVVVGLFLPTNYTVTRSVTIQAPPEAVWPFINDLRKWKVWSPWEEEDPTIVTTLGEPVQGEGANMSWTGQTGNGRMVVTDVVPNEALVTELYMTEGQDPASGSFVIEPEGGASRVDWSLAGEVPVPVLGGYVATFIMPAVIGPVFDRGLEKMKVAVESAPDQPLL